MLTSSRAEKCAECSGDFMDAGEELVCGSCGVVAEKQYRDAAPGRPLRVSDFTTRSLGAYLGPPDSAGHEDGPRGLLGSGSTFRYLKVISDFAGKEDSTLWNTMNMVERVSEKLNLPSIVAVQAAIIAKKLFLLKRQQSDVTSAAVSAYAIIMACRIERVTSIGVKEIVEAHRALGRRVRISALIELSLNAPVKVPARGPADYVGRVIARLPAVGSLSDSLREAGLNEVAYLNSLREGALAALDLAGGTSWAGHSPCALAATAVYAAEAASSRAEGRRKLLTQKNVAECVGVAEYTVREQFGDVFRPIMAPLQERAPSRRSPSAGQRS